MCAAGARNEAMAPPFAHQSGGCAPQVVLSLNSSIDPARAGAVDDATCFTGCVAGTPRPRARRLHFAPHPRALLPTRLTPHRARRGRLAQLRQGGRRRRPGLGAALPPLSRARAIASTSRATASPVSPPPPTRLPAVSPPPRPPPPRPPRLSPTPTRPPPTQRPRPSRVSPRRASPATTVATSSRATTAALGPEPRRRAASAPEPRLRHGAQRSRRVRAMAELSERDFTAERRGAAVVSLGDSGASAPGAPGPGGVSGPGVPRASDPSAESLHAHRLVLSPAARHGRETRRRRFWTRTSAAASWSGAARWRSRRRTRGSPPTAARRTSRSGASSGACAERSAAACRWWTPGTPSFHAKISSASSPSSTEGANERSCS